MVQSEADIIEYFVRANIPLLDHMFIVLNPSEDGTAEILAELVYEGLPLTIWPTQMNHYAQSEVISAVANRIRDQFQPEFLCLLDADEIFLVNDRAVFNSNLHQINEGAVGLVPWQTFVPPSNEQSYAFFPDQWNERLEFENEQFYKVIIPRMAADRDEIRITNGQHEVMLKDGKPLKGKVLSDVTLAHLPVRSVPQIRTKTYASIISKGIAEGFAWQGSESFQRKTVRSYFERTEKPDVREIASLYLHQDWLESPAPPCIKDNTLPRPTLGLNNLVRHMQQELQLLSRIEHSVYPLPDPTEEFLKSSKVDTEFSGAVASGIFPAEFHSHNLKLDWPPFAHIQNRFRPSAVLDVGCGLGAYLKLFSSLGVKVFGVDGAPWSCHHFISENDYIQLDLARNSFTLERSFDVAIFVEVAEHLSKECSFAIIDQISTQTTHAIVFSAAQPGQPGFGHINLQEPEFWLSRFRANGWEVDPAGTISLRTLSTLHWFRRNLFLLVRKPKRNSFRTQDLIDLGTHRTMKEKSKWPQHRSGETVIGFPGQRPYFSMSGYGELPPLFCNRIAKLEYQMRSISHEYESLKQISLSVDEVNARLALEIKRNDKLMKVLSQSLRRPWRPVRDYFLFGVLKGLFVFMPVLPRKTKAKLYALSVKTDPRRFERSV
jgi:SAM-dependent methyltransferase